MKDRFRGYLPVILDLETGGFNSDRNPILELACAFVSMKSGRLQICAEFCWAVSPFAGATIEESSLKITGIDLDNPDRMQVAEKAAITSLFKLIRKRIKLEECTRAILVAHNASFDQGFLHAACDRSGIKRNPFHPFSTTRAHPTRAPRARARLPDLRPLQSIAVWFPSRHATADTRSGRSVWYNRAGPYNPPSARATTTARITTKATQ